MNSRPKVMLILAIAVQIHVFQKTIDARFMTI